MYDQSNTLKREHKHLPVGISTLCRSCYVRVLRQSVLRQSVLRQNVLRQNVLRQSVLR